MNTIIVIFTHIMLVNAKEIRLAKAYSFNTNSEVQVGDMLKSQSYNTNMQVIKVLPKAYVYYNASTGKLSNTYNSTQQKEIATLELRDDCSNIIYACKITKK